MYPAVKKGVRPLPLPLSFGFLYHADRRYAFVYESGVWPQRGVKRSPDAYVSREEI